MRRLKAVGIILLTLGGFSVFELIVSYQQFRLYVNVASEIGPCYGCAGQLQSLPQIAFVLALILVFSGILALKSNRKQTTDNQARTTAS